MTKLHSMCVRSTITERSPAIISTIVPGFQPTQKNKKYQGLFSKLMYNDMEWIGLAKLQVLWFYTESRQETGEDGDIVLILRNCTDKKKPFKVI